MYIESQNSLILSKIEKKKSFELNYGLLKKVIHKDENRNISGDSFSCINPGKLSKSLEKKIFYFFNSNCDSQTNEISEKNNSIKSHPKYPENPLGNIWESIFSFFSTNY